jgi:hypothetical protein
VSQFKRDKAAAWCAAIVSSSPTVALEAVGRSWSVSSGEFEAGLFPGWGYIGEG